MLRCLPVLVLLLALVVGCGQSESLTLSEQGHKALNRGQYDEAVALFDEAIRANPRDFKSFVLRGRAYHCRNGNGDLDRAVTDFSEAIRIAPEDAQAYYSRALAYRDLSEPEKSAADDHKARELDSELKSIYAKLPETPRPVPELPRQVKEIADTKSEADPVADDPGDLHDSVRDRVRAAERAARNNSIPGVLRGELEDGLTPRPPAAAPSTTRPYASPPVTPFVPSNNLNRDPAAPTRPGTSEEPDDTLNPNLIKPLPLGKRGSGSSSRARSSVSTAPPVINPFGAESPSMSPWQRSQGAPATGFQSDLDSSSVQSPFPQPRPRPTGIVNQPANPFAQPSQRQTSAPANVNQRAGAKQSDFDP